MIVIAVAVVPVVVILLAILVAVLMAVVSSSAFFFHAFFPLAAGSRSSGPGRARARPSAVRRLAEPLRSADSTNGGPRQLSQALAQPAGLGARGGQIFLQLQIKRGPKSRCQLRSMAAGHALSTGRETAGLRSLLPAMVVIVARVRIVVVVVVVVIVVVVVLLVLVLVSIVLLVGGRVGVVVAILFVVVVVVVIVVFVKYKQYYVYFKKTML